MNRPARRQATATSKAKGFNRSWLIYGSIAVVVIGLIVAVAISSYTPPPAAAPEPVALTVGQQAPEFAVSTDAGPFDLAAVKGRPVFLEVFATWCPHCQRETVILNKLFGTYKDRVSFVAVSGSPVGMDHVSSSSQADVMNFVQQFSVQYPVAFDANMDVAHKYMQAGYPTIIVIGKGGTIRTILSGEVSEKLLRGDLDKAISSPV
ncbi:MAG TPA: TlpA disulfide reductase family protein [Candidatus Baltobacteraceae bacterium]